MSQGSSAPSLAIRNRNARPPYNLLVAGDGAHQGHDMWPGIQQYFDPQVQNVTQSAACGQYDWVDSYDDSGMRPSNAGVDKNANGYMFNGHLENHDRIPAPEYPSWYTSQDIGEAQNFQPVTFPVGPGSWYATSSAYMDGTITSQYSPNDMIWQTSSSHTTIPVTGSGADVLPPTLSTQPPPTEKPPLSRISSCWSEDTLLSNFTDNGISISVGIDPLMPSVGSEFDFPGLGLFSIDEPPQQTKIEAQTFDHIHHHVSSQIKSERSGSEGSSIFLNESVTKSLKPAVRKRRVSPPAGTQVVLASKGKTSFNDCVTVFETVPGAISQTKRRRKLSPSSHESFKVTRKIGACLECRFRKRPCAPGTPCPYCIKIFGPQDIAEVNCHRESPFVGYTVTDYFLVTSNKRIIDFTLKLPMKEENNALIAPQEYIVIDGLSGPCCLPTRVPVRQQLFSELGMEDQAEIWRTRKRPRASDEPCLDMPEYVIVPAEDDETLGNRLEDWAIKYATKFSRFHSGRYPTAYAYNVGICYVAKQLPEHDLIATLLKGTALAYVLRAGVKCTPNAAFQVVQAKIDTILYQRLRAAEVIQFAMLQRLVWVSAGRLKQQQLYPVAYVIWQTMRSNCLRASHLANLQCRFKAPSNSAFAREVDHLGHCFNLLLATHTALFRSNSPILLDFTQPNNAALLGGDAELIQEAMKLRRVILNFQEYSLSRPFRSSNWYRDNMYRRFRSILHGRGFQLDGEEKNKPKVPVEVEKGSGNEKAKGKGKGKGTRNGNGRENGNRNKGIRDKVMESA